MYDAGFYRIASEARITYDVEMLLRCIAAHQRTDISRVQLLRRVAVWVRGVYLASNDQPWADTTACCIACAPEDNLAACRKVRV